VPETAEIESAVHDTLRPPTSHHFVTMDQQEETANLGMWVFLVTEIMFFGGLFCGYAIYRNLYSAGFEAGSRLLEIKYGTLNTAVLITSSLTMALSVHASQTNRRKALIILLIVTMLLGSLFICIKGLEYYHKWEHGLVPGLNWNPAPGEIPPGVSPYHVEMFICFYFFMTLVHALHMTIGLGILAVLLIMAIRHKFSDKYFTPVEVSGLYWHFVDIVWIFLFPLLYLLGGRY
jgi:cytochrome c oxidase subunit III